MNCPDLVLKCPENPDKDTRTDTRARIRNPDTCPSGFPSALPCPVSGLCPAEKLSKPLSQPVHIHGSHCLLTQARGKYIVVAPGGAEIACADSRFLAVARAATSLARTRVFPQGA